MPCLLAWLVCRTGAPNKASSNHHAEYFVHLPNTFTGKCAQLPHLLTVKENEGLLKVVFFQEAVAQGLLWNSELLGQPECYFSSLSEELQGKRDRMAAILKDAGMTPVIPEGGYFMLVDVTPLSESPDMSDGIKFP